MHKVCNMFPAGLFTIQGMLCSAASACRDIKELMCAIRFRNVLFCR